MGNIEKLLSDRPAIRIMATAARQWRADNPNAEPDITVNKRDPYFMLGGNSEAAALNDRMVDAAEAEGFFVSDREVAAATWIAMSPDEFDQILAAKPF